MALARSSSGPGGLSINTTSANSLFGTGAPAPATGAMFGSTQAKPSTGLFGSSLNSAPATAGAPGGGLFGAAQPAQSTGTGTGIFGTATATSQPAASGGLFGSTSASAAPSGGLFGSAPTAQSAQNTGLFGSNPTTQPTQSTSLFGTNTSGQPAPSGSLFGAAKPATSGLFGSTTTGAPAAATTSLFGTATMSQPQMASVAGQTQAANSLFGGSTAQTSFFGQPQNQQAASAPQQQSSLFGGGISQPLGTLGRSTQTQMVPGVRIDASQIKGTTRSNDLHEDIQKQLEEMDKFIQSQIGFQRQCEAIMPRHHEDLTCVPPGVDLLSRQQLALEDALALDARQISQVRSTALEDAERAKLSFKVVENLKLPPQFHTPGLWAGPATTAPGRTGSNEAVTDLTDYFANTADEMEQSLKKFHQNFSEVEYHLRTVEAASAQQLNSAMARRDGDTFSNEDPARELGLALVEFEESLLGVASKVGRARQGIQKLQLGDFPAATADRHHQAKRQGIY